MGMYIQKKTCRFVATRRKAEKQRTWEPEIHKKSHNEKNSPKKIAIGIGIDIDTVVALDLEKK